MIKKTNETGKTGVCIAMFLFIIICLQQIPALSCDCNSDDRRTGPWHIASAEGASARTECSPDGYTLKITGGAETKEINCMKEQGGLCENGKCVCPWSYGSPKWPTAGNAPLATKETLTEKASYYENQAERLLLNPKLKWMTSVELPCKKIECAPGAPEPCRDCTASAVPEEEATVADVVKWHSGENDGLFSSLYLAAEGFRYAATKDPQALRQIKVLLDGEVIRMEITGVPGLFTRQYIPPGVSGISCPGKLEEYIPDKEKDDNQWVRVGDGGCVMIVDPKSKEWKTTNHCGLEKYAGWCWLDNVSKDEYSGHMFALGVIAKLVDDPEAQTTTKGLLKQVAEHMIKNKMNFVDWDGRIAEHGRINALALDDYPGFNAAMGLDFISVAAEATGDPKIKDWYDNCLLQKKGKSSCLKKLTGTPGPFTEYLHLTGMYRGTEGCGSNYNNISMNMLSIHNLVWFERDPVYKEKYQRILDEMFISPGEPRALVKQNNAFFDFIYASQKRLGPGSDGPALKVVENGIGMLRQFPARKHPRDVECPAGKCAKYCENRFGDPEGNYARMISERCLGAFEWWSDPYSPETCKKNERIIYPATDYLLAYWMGRYYGFIGESM